MHYGTLQHSGWLPVSSVSLFLITALLLSNGNKYHQGGTLAIQLLPHFSKAAGQSQMTRGREFTCIEAKTTSKNTLLMARSEQMHINISSAS